MTKFWLGEENFPPRKILPDKIFIDKVIVFPKSVVTPSKIRTVINFYAKSLKRFPEKLLAYIVDLAFIGQKHSLKILKITETRTLILKLS